MARDAMAISCLSCVVKPCEMANEDVQKRLYAKTSKCGSRTKGHKGISAVPNDPSSKHRIQSIPIPHSLWPPQRFMPIIWKPSIRLYDDVVRPIAGAPICMPRTQGDSRKDEMCTGLCIISSACTLQPVKSLQWHWECWSLVYLSMRYSFFERLLKSRTHVDLTLNGTSASEHS